MFRSRKACSTVCLQIKNWISGSKHRQSEEVERLARMTLTIHSRQRAGKQTSLRQLHTITDLSQPEALAIVAQLERAQVVSIERDMADAFESKVTMSDQALHQLALAKRKVPEAEIA